MINKVDIDTIKSIKKEFVDQVGSGGIEFNDVDYKLISRIECLDTLLHNLEIAKYSYRYASEEDVKANFYTADCDKCGWWGSSKFLLGGGQIGDTGDYGDFCCPVCGNTDLDEKEPERKPDVEIKTDRHKWVSYNIIDDYWVECEITGIKIFDWGFGANKDGQLLYDGNVVEFPKWIKVKQI